MHKGIVATIAAVLMATLSAYGTESFQQRLNKANADLANGKIDEALTAYRDLQTEDPESETLYYDFGCAHYRQGKEAAAQKQAQDALTSLEEAKKSFEKVVNARDPEIRKNAAFAHANTVAQIAIQSKEAQKYEETTKAFEESVKEYEAFLKQYPGHQGAHAKLDYMRYLLKSMLQNPPPPQPQQQQGQGDKDKDQKKDEQKDQKDQQGQDQQKQDQQKQDEQKQDQQKQDEQKQGENKDQEKKDEKSDKAQEASELKEAPKDQQDQQEGAQDEAKPDDKQNVDAILQSLEDTDHREQRDMKNQRNEVKMRKEWW